MLLTIRGPRGAPGWKGVCLVVAAAFTIQLLPVAALAAPPPQEDLDAAIEHYNFARFDQAIESLRALIDSGDLSRGEEERAFDYLGRAYVKRGLGGDREQAKWAFQQMLERNPDRVLTDLEVPPDIVAVFNEAKAEMGEAPGEKPPEEKAKEEETPEFEFPERKAPMVEEGGTDMISWLLLGGTVAAGGLWMVTNSGVSSKNDDIDAAIADGTISQGLFDDADSAASTRDLFAIATIALGAATVGYFIMKSTSGRGFFSAGLGGGDEEEDGKSVALDLDVKGKSPYLGLAVRF
jgi:hypothetical protein